MNNWSPELISIRNLLAALFFRLEDSYPILDSANISKTSIAFSSRPITNWHAILDYAKELQGGVERIIRAALEQYPNHPGLKHALDGTLRPPPESRLEPTPLAPRDQAHFEKQTGAQSTLLPISFLATGLVRARAVVRVICDDGFGTGFLTANSILITNKHVLPTVDAASTATIEFGYDQPPTGALVSPDKYRLSPGDGFEVATDESDDDWSAVRVAGKPQDNWGYVPLRKVQIRKDDFVNIIQHPGGGYKHIALYHNVVEFTNSTRLQYLTDTLPGSSGSPVFNSAWDVVALHHSGGWIKEPGSSKSFYRNEGTHINVLVDALTGSGMLP